MTESEWLTSADPAAMLRLLVGNDANYAEGLGGRLLLTDRKLRLFACACCRQPEVWARLTDDSRCPRKTCHGGLICTNAIGTRTCPDCAGTGRVNRSRRAVEVAERWAEAGEEPAEAEVLNRGFASK